MKRIALTKNKFALVDDEDWIFLECFKWRCAHGVDNRQFYASGGIEGQQIRMHRYIMDTPPGMLCDHIDGDGLNNQKHNLRNVTPQQNQMNCKRHDGKWKGVIPCSGSVPGFYGRIQVNGKQYGSEKVGTRHEAAQEYDKLAIKHHGEFASLNFPERDL